MIRNISGWGNTSVAQSAGFKPRTVSDVRKYCISEDGFVVRGMGRSYGDSAVYSKHVDMTALNNLVEFDDRRGILTAQAGITLGDILEFIVPRGWFLGTTPGTKFVTLGGAIASDVHGKNHHHYGCFSSGVLEIQMVDERGKLRIITPDDELFRYVCGGMGLYGVITQATIELIKIRSAYVSQTTYRAQSVDRLCRLMTENYNASYSVAWITCLGSSNAVGRGLLMIGEHCADSDFDMPKKRPKSVPMMMPGFLLNSITVRALNVLYYRRVLFRKSKQRVSYEKFFYPLDGIHHWNRIYGKRGFVQYHCVLPKQNGVEGIKKLLKKISQSGMGSFLSVLKLLGRQNNNALSFPLEGYTFALDFKMSHNTKILFRSLDAIVSQYGGRVYLSKDACATPKMIRSGYPNYDTFAEHRKEKRKKFTSLQAQRLQL